MQTIKYLIKFAFFPRKVSKEMLEEIYARNIIFVRATAVTLIAVVGFAVEKHRQPGVLLFLAGICFISAYISSFVSGAFIYFLDKISAKKIPTYRKCYKMALINSVVPLLSVIFKFLLLMYGLSMTGWADFIFTLCNFTYDITLLLYYLKKFYAYNKRDMIVFACIYAIPTICSIVK